MPMRSLLTILGLVALCAVPFLVTGYVTHVVILTFLAIIVGASFRLLMLGGQASFCHGAFYGIGGYVTAILALRYGLGIWPLAIVAALAAGITAIVIGAVSLRTKGPYFFLMTFGFLMVFDSAVSNMASLTGGYSGLANIPPPTGVRSQLHFYFAIMGACAVVLAVLAYLDRSVYGIQLRAIGNADDLAEAIGVPRTRYLVAAFAIGAALVGFGGAFYASYITFVSPNSFGLAASINALTYNVVGGFNTLLGPMLGAAYVTLVPLAFDWSAELIQIFVSASIIAAMMFRPDGIEGLLAWSRKLPAGKDQPKPQTGAQAPKPSIRSDLVTHIPVGDAGAAGEPVLAVRDLRFGFGGVRIADGIDLFVRANEVVGLIGPNGAGKSTIFNLISGFLTPESGAILLRGTTISGLRPASIAQRGLVRTFQATAAFDGLTTFDNILVAALGAEARQSPLGAWRRKAAYPHAYGIARHCLAFAGLERFAQTQAADLPYGAKKMLGLAMALACKPTLLCLDEPVTGLTGYEVEEFVQLVRRLKEERGIAILLVEHRMPVVAELCDRVYALHGGKICAEGTPSEVTSNDTVRRIYLGESRSHRRA